MSPNIGIIELVLLCLGGLLGLVLPAVILIFLVYIFKKLKNIEELLKKDQ